MCEGIDMGSMFTGQNMIMASGALKAVGGLVQANQGAKYLEYQGAQAEADAQAEREIGQVRAGRVRKAGARVNTEALAAQGASGSSVNSGSALAVREYIDRSSENDALMELYGGIARGKSLEATAAGYRSQAGLTRTAGYMGAGNSLLAGAAGAYQAKLASSKWITRRRADEFDNSALDNYG